MKALTTHGLTSVHVETLKQWTQEHITEARKDADDDAKLANLVGLVKLRDVLTSIGGDIPKEGEEEETPVTNQPPARPRKRSAAGPSPALPPKRDAATNDPPA